MTKAFPEITTQKAWQSKLDQFIEEEKELTRLQDQLNAKRRRLPVVEVEQPYIFEGENGSVSLLDLFSGRSQLIVYHFMFGPDADAGCPGCSWLIDAMTHPAHIEARDTSIVLVSRGPLDKLLGYKQRMGWSIDWYSSQKTTFNIDMGATTQNGEVHRISVFIRDGEKVYRSYTTTGRGLEYLGTQWSYLDITPYGRQETWEDSPSGWPQSAPYEWINRHDEY